MLKVRCACKIESSKACYDKDTHTHAYICIYAHTSTDTEAHIDRQIHTVVINQLIRESKGKTSLKILSSCTGTGTPLLIHETLIYSAVFQQLTAYCKKV